MASPEHNQPSRPRRAPAPLWALLGLLLLSPALCAADPEDQAQARRERAQNFSTYDFEPRVRDLWAHRDRNGDGWPDYWEPIIDEDHPAQSVNRAKIVVDPARPGYYLGEPGHVLSVPFDGTPIAIQTRYPKVVDPDLAYEVSMHGRMQGMNGSLVRVWLIWLNSDDEGYLTELDRDALQVPPGQVDWPEAPITLRINDLPERDGLRTNRMRVLLELSDDPGRPAADRHGTAWFDDIRIESRPKLRIRPVIREFDPQDPTMRLPLRIGYLGLVENLPDARGQGAAAKRYSRSIGITDVFGREPTDNRGVSLLDTLIPRNRDINPGASREYEEVINIDLRQFGLYYVTARLYGSDRTVQARVSQVIGMLPPARQLRPGTRSLIESSGTYAVNLGAPPVSILEDKGNLARWVRRAGVYNLKANLWPATTNEAILSGYVARMGPELREIRTSGGRVTGVLDASPFSPLPMAAVMRERTSDLARLFERTVPHLGPHIEAWQWGDDSDSSFTKRFDADALTATRTQLSNRASVMSEVFPISLGATTVQLPPDRVGWSSALHVPPEMTLDSLLDKVAPLLADKLYRFHNPHIYPSADLMRITPPRRIGESVLQDDLDRAPPREPWVSIELKPVPRHERSATAERAQLEDMATKAILAKALGIRSIELGKLIGSDSGLTNLERGGELTPRPSLLAARVLEDHLGGRSYLGSLELPSPPRQAEAAPGEFRNFVFGDARGEDAVIAIWYDGPGDSELLERTMIATTPLRLVDMAGNTREIQRENRIPVHKVPMLIEGLSVPLLKTRMSVRILDDPPLHSRSSLQPQVISMRNYFLGRQLPAEIQMRYAANHAFRLEQNWTVRPDTISDINLPGAEPNQIPTASIPYMVKPSNVSSMGLRPELPEADKYVQMTLDLNVSPPVRMTLMRRTRLRSDLSVVVVKPEQKEDEREVQLHLQIRWFPRPGTTAQAAITLEPYFARQAELPTRLRKVSIPRYSERTADAPARVVRVRVPRSRRGQPVWIGLEEDGGDRFFRADVTDLVPPLTEF